MTAFLATGATGIEPPEPVLYNGMFDDLPPIVEEVPEETIKTPPDAILGLSGYVGQCISLAKIHANAMGEKWGNARDIKPNSQEPNIGNLVLTNESHLGHVAVITDIRDNQLILSESNLNWDGLVTHGRELSATSTVIRGYFDLSTTTPGKYVD